MKDSTKNRILDVSVRLFGEQGLDKTRVEHIVEHARISRATFYNYFHSKEEVAFFLIDDELGKQTEQMRRAIQNETDPYKKLKALFVCEMNGVMELRRLLKAEIEDFELLPAIPRKLVMKKVESDLEIVIDILAYGVASGAFEVDDPRLTANIILNTLNVYIGPFSTEKMNPASIGRDVDRMIKALSFGFAKRPRESRR